MIRLELTGSTELFESLSSFLSHIIREVHGSGVHKNLVSLRPMCSDEDLVVSSSELPFSFAVFKRLFNCDLSMSMQFDDDMEFLRCC